MAEKARLRRKDLKQPDEFINLSGRAVTWGRGHRQMVNWIGAGLVGVLVIAGIATAYRAAQVRDANADLARAMAKLDDGNYAVASAELVEVSDRWAGSSVAPLAALLGANAALRAGEADKAIAELGKIQPQAGSLPPYLRQQMLLAWGAALEAKQQWLDAAAKYAEAGALSGPYSGDAVLAEARTRERGGETDRAKELYRRAHDQFPNLPDRDLLTAKLQ